MLTTLCGSFYVVLTVLPLFARSSHTRNNSVIGRPFDVERLNEFTPLGPVARSRHGRDESKNILNPMRIIRREHRRAAFVPAESDQINKLLHHLDRDKKYLGKRERDGKHQVLKCLQQPSDGITCFGNGKFYQFTGSVEKLTAGNISEMVQESEGVERSGAMRGDTKVRSQAEYTPVRNALPFRKLWKKRSPDKTGHQAFAVRPFQEVLMQPHGLTAGPTDCYGFIAPKLVHKPQNAIGKSCALTKKCEHRMCTCGGGCNKLARKRRLTDRKKTHPIWKRSHMITVACRPLYVPTPKPSVNEGRVAKCRLPCGEHNCLVVPTCPCMPPCKTQAPCPSTCPPEKPMPCCTKPPDIPRCPPYEITEEPCPPFPCPDKFPFLTTPHCPCSKESCSSCSCTKETACGKTSCSEKPSCYSKNMAGIVTTAMADLPSSTTAKPCNSKNVGGIITTAKASISRSTVSRLSPSMPPVAVKGTIKADVTGTKMRGNENLRTGVVEVEPGKLRPRMIGLWPSFDLRKLLKSAKYLNKDKAEQDKAEPVPPV